uniref:Uncharacterized protein n=1 Tax=Anguilla anguilla TaxID=7936 RepID=A0A0E9XTM0_ANGAN
MPWIMSSSLLHTLLFPSFWYKLTFVPSVHRM